MLNPSPTLVSKLLVLLRGLVVLAVGLTMACHGSVQVRSQDALDARATTYAANESVREPLGRSAEEVDEIIERVIHQGMVARGYEPAASAALDLLVSRGVPFSSVPSRTSASPRNPGVPLSMRMP